MNVINFALIAKQFAFRKLNQFFNPYSKDRKLNKYCQQLRNTKNLRFCISSSTQASDRKLDQNYFKRTLNLSFLLLYSSKKTARIEKKIFIRDKKLLLLMIIKFL
jgi:hypothetical protein